MSELLILRIIVAVILAMVAIKAIARLVWWYASLEDKNEFWGPIFGRVRCEGVIKEVRKGWGGGGWWGEVGVQVVEDGVKSDSIITLIARNDVVKQLAKIPLGANITFSYQRKEYLVGNCLGDIISIHQLEGAGE